MDLNMTIPLDGHIDLAGDAKNTFVLRKILGPSPGAREEAKCFLFSNERQK
jgi:hypothetical protein